MVLAATVHAQERTAGQAYDAQVNWSALKNSIDLVSSQNKVLAAIITKMQVCNQKKKIYAPGNNDADSDGCVSVVPHGLQGVAVDINAADARKFITAATRNQWGRPSFMDWNAYCRSKGYLYLSALVKDSSYTPYEAVPGHADRVKGGPSSTQTLYCVGLPH